MYVYVYDRVYFIQKKTNVHTHVFFIYIYIYIYVYECIYSICVQIHNFIGGCNYVCIFLNICTNTYEIAEHLKGSVSFDWMSCDSFRAETWAWEKVHKIANRLNHQRPPAHAQHRPWNPLIGMVASDMWKKVQLAQLCNPTAKGSSKVPGMFRFFRACIFVWPLAPDTETQQIRGWEFVLVPFIFTTAQ